MNFDKLIYQHTGLKPKGESFNLIKKQRLVNRKIVGECLSVFTSFNIREENNRLKTKLISVTSVARGESFKSVVNKVKESSKNIPEQIKKLINILKEFLEQMSRSLSSIKMKASQLIKALNKVNIPDKANYNHDFINVKDINLNRFISLVKEYGIAIEEEVNVNNFSKTAGEQIFSGIKSEKIYKEISKYMEKSKNPNTLTGGRMSAWADYLRQDLEAVIAFEKDYVLIRKNFLNTCDKILKIIEKTDKPHALANGKKFLEISSRRLAVIYGVIHKLAGREIRDGFILLKNIKNK